MKNLNNKYKIGFLDIIRCFNSTVALHRTALNEKFITGFTDAEGCFYIRITKKNSMKIVELWNLYFLFVYIQKIWLY